MPIYEYECSKCGHRFEVIQKISDAPVKKCEKCKGKTDRLISSPAIQFKGSGWYADGYSKKKSSGSDSSESKDASASTDSAKTKDTSSKESSGAESKPKSGSKKKAKKEAKGSSGSSK